MMRRDTGRWRWLAGWTLALLGVPLAVLELLGRAIEEGPLPSFRV